MTLSCTGNHESSVWGSDCCVQVVNREEKPYYEITAGEHPEYIAPEDAAKLIFHKMKGVENTHMHIQMHTG